MSLYGLRHALRRGCCALDRAGAWSTARQQHASTFSTMTTGQKEGTLATGVPLRTDPAERSARETESNTSTSDDLKSLQDQPALGDVAQASAGAEQASEPFVPKIVVFGGRGFVGSHVCQEALNTGLKVVGVSKSGTPPIVRDSWVDQVDWVRGNALEPQSYLHHLNGAVAAISCIGGFGSDSEMLKVNGTANVTFIEAAKSAGVPRLVFISAHIPNIPGIDFALGGYIRGKAQAEEAVRRCYPDAGVVLRPGIIYGNRAVTTSFSLPLQVALQPLEYALSFAPTKKLASIPVLGAVTTPPSSVQAVARAAVRAATDPAVPAGVLDVWEIAQYK